MKALPNSTSQRRGDMWLGETVSEVAIMAKMCAFGATLAKMLDRFVHERGGVGKITGRSLILCVKCTRLHEVEHCILWLTLVKLPQRH